MQFQSPLQVATLLRRYKRFLADVELADQSQLTIHCPNTGSMLGCNTPGSRIWYSTVAKAKRKYPHTWEIIEIGDHQIGINTHRANALVREGILQGIITELQGYDQIKAEVKYGQEKSRIDFLLENQWSKCFVEVKNVTLAENNIGYFPDAVTARGTKHLRELMTIKKEGHRAVLCFCVQHSGVLKFAPAHTIDPLYTHTLIQAHKSGVELIAYQAEISTHGIILTQALPVWL